VWFDTALKGVFLLGAVAALDLLLRRASSATRHLVWTSTLVGLLLMPLLSSTLPARFAMPQRFPHLPQTMAPARDLAVPRAISPDAATQRVEFSAWSAASVARATGAFGSASGAFDSPTRLGEFESKTAPPEPREALEIAPVAEPSSASRAALWLSWILPLWAVGALCVAGWFALQHGSVRYLAQRARVLHDATVLHLVEQLRHELGLSRPVRVLSGGMADMPMTWGFRNAVLLLPHGFQDWPLSSKRNVLLHELAHVKRRDHLTQLLAQLACTLHWFNPFVWYAARRMYVEREHACDDCVLNAGSRPSDYAQNLLDIADSMRGRRLDTAAAIAMARRSTLPERLKAVLDARRRRRERGLLWTAAALLLTSALVVPLAAVDLEKRAERDRDRARARRSVWSFGDLKLVPLEPLAPIAPLPPLTPLPPIPPIAPIVALELADLEPLSGFLADIDVLQGLDGWLVSRDGEPVIVAGEGGGVYVVRGDGSEPIVVASGDQEGRSVVRISNGTTNLTWSDGNHRLRIRSRGEIEFSKDGSDVVSISKGGYLEIEEDDGDTERRVKLKGERGGEVSRKWYVDGDQLPWDDEAQAWLETMIPEFARRTGFAADARVAQILAQDGVDAVLDEIERIESDYVKRIYFRELTSQAEMNAEQLHRVLEHAGREISSDFELAQLLIEAAREGPLDAAGRVAYAEATRSIGSDFEQSRALVALAKSNDLDEAALAALLDAAAEIGSDFELAKLLVEVARRHGLSGDAHDAYFDALDSVGSDFEHRKVLASLLEQRELPPETHAAIIVSARRNIGSDYEMAELLIEIAHRAEVTGAALPPFVEALRTIGSDYEFRRVASALVAGTRLDDAALTEVLQAASREVGSDYEMAELLVEIAHEYKLEGEVREAYLRASDTVGSSYENKRVLAALVESER
jgi:beta-lactamase regulating signal transducer with metallopeptidase domain